ncbi:MAG: right-handed parallel beta-helix repeat-containing protein [Acidimicrobiia bacterium]|nr:right-handed parallel beta-helix repeat-containing protein [Acidimicrobiia bacterium]
MAAGQSIQAAVNAANPGDTIRVAAGTFRESVEVTKAVSIIGAGQGSTILVPPASAPTSQTTACFDPSSPTEFDGFCIHGTVDPNTGNATAPIGPVRVSGFTVKSFNGIGVLFYGTTSPQVDHNTLVGNSDYGTAAFVSTDDVITANIARGNGEAGIYVGDSPGARAKVTGNSSTGNDDFGIFVRDASGPGTISGNEVRGNCGGILFLNTGANPSNWDASGNIASANDSVCTPDGGPAVGGIGIAVSGVNSVNIHDNIVRNNVASGPVTISGGVAVADGASQTTVTGNQIQKNNPDIYWDGSGTGNSFAGNSCKTSVPAGLC